MENNQQQKSESTQAESDSSQGKMMTYGKFSGPNQSTLEDFKIAEYKDDQQG